MKLLVCTDGSKHSQKALEKAAKIAGGCNATEVAIIHVYEAHDIFIGEGASISQTEHMRELEEQRKKDLKKILINAVRFMEAKNIRASAIFKEGHPAEIITKVAEEGGFDLVIMGSRGLGGLKKLLLGSVSGTVVHESSVSVLTVK